MTIRVKVSHMEEDSYWDLVVSSSYLAEKNELPQVIEPGSSFEFLVHSAKNLIIGELPHIPIVKKNGEAE